MVGYVIWCTTLCNSRSWEWATVQQTDRRPADHAWPLSIPSLYSQNCIPRLLLWTDFHCRSNRLRTCFKHCLLQFIFGKFNCYPLTMLFMALWSWTYTTVCLNIIEMLPQQQSFHFISKRTKQKTLIYMNSNNNSKVTVMHSRPCLITYKGHIVKLQLEEQFWCTPGCH